MSLISAIGNTPLVELPGINPQKDKVRILGKLEGSNPGGSIKDRPAYYMIKAAEEAGLLTHEKTIIEPTSGNTGIGLAMIAAAKGYRITLTLPRCVSAERKMILEALGAAIVLTPACDGTDGAIRMASRMLEENPGKYYMPNQFTNMSNVQSHYETTGPEIYEQTRGAVSACVIGMGTTGTLMGVTRYLKQKNSAITMVGVEPPPGHAIQGLKNMNEAIVPAIYDSSLHDVKLTVGDAEAFDATRALALKEGLFVGMSSGAAVAGALKVARDMAAGSTVVAILPDRGDRYLSTSLFKSICAQCPP